MLVTCPLYFGLSAVAPDAVSVILGSKWAEMAPLVRVLALAMPVFTLTILFAPAVNAVGQAKVTMQASLLGALIMPAAFLVGVRWGAPGLAWAWLLALPALPLFNLFKARDVLSIAPARFAGAIAPGIGAGAAMAVPVFAFQTALAAWSPLPRLALSVALGGVIYSALLLLVSRATLFELLSLVFRREGGAAPAR
jgi:O-antigen/teichoic acid export membrane protein